jgi:hypothetical protein
MGSWWGVRTCFRTRCQGTVFNCIFCRVSHEDHFRAIKEVRKYGFRMLRLWKGWAPPQPNWLVDDDLCLPWWAMMSFFLFLFMTNGGWLSLSASNFGRTSACHGHNSILDQDIRYSNQKCQNHMPIGREHLQVLRVSPCFPHDMSRFPVHFPTNPVSVRWTYSPLVEQSSGQATWTKIAEVSGWLGHQLSW